MRYTIRRFFFARYLFCGISFTSSFLRTCKTGVLDLVIMFEYQLLCWSDLVYSPNPDHYSWPFNPQLNVYCSSQSKFSLLSPFDWIKLFCCRITQQLGAGHHLITSGGPSFSLQTDDWGNWHHAFWCENKTPWLVHQYHQYHHHHHHHRRL